MLLDIILAYNNYSHMKFSWSLKKVPIIFEYETVYLLESITRYKLYKMTIVYLDAGTEWTLSTMGILLKARLLRFAVLRSSLPQIGASLWSGLF